MAEFMAQESKTYGDTDLYQAKKNQAISNHSGQSKANVWAELKGTSDNRPKVKSVYGDSKKSATEKLQNSF